MKRTRIRTRVVVASLLALALVAAGCGGDDDDDDDASSSGTETEETSAPAEVPDGPTIVIGAQDFGESAILSQIYGQALENAGYSVEYQDLGGFRDIVFSSFESGDINFTPEYAASALEFLNGQAGEASSDVDATVEALRAQLEGKGLQALDPSPAVDSNSFVVTAEKAEELGLSKVSDLTPDLKLGGPPDCPENASCIPGLQTVYGIDMTAKVYMGPTKVAAFRNDILALRERYGDASS